MARSVQLRISVRDSVGNVSVIDAQGFINEPPVIEQVLIDPPVLRPGHLARITILAKDPEDEPMAFEVHASEGTIERTDQPNVFIWRAA